MRSILNTKASFTFIDIFTSTYQIKKENPYALAKRVSFNLLTKGKEKMTVYNKTFFVIPLVFELFF